MTIPLRLKLPLLALVFGPIGILPLAGQDSLESNNSQATATALPSNFKSWVATDLTFHVIGDEDWFTIHSTATEDLTVSIRYQHNFFNSTHGSFEVRDDTGEILATPDGFLANFTTNHRSVTFQTSPGSKYHVRYFSLGGNAINYTALFSRPIEPDSDEVNDTLAGATDLGPLPLNGDLSLSGMSLHTSSDRDFYRMESTVNGFIALSLEAELTFGDVRMRVTDIDGNILREKTNSASEWGGLFQVETGKAYLVEVFAQAGQLHPEYHLSIQQQLAADDNEPNDTPATATILESLVANVSTLVNNQNRDRRNDNDYFRISKLFAGRIQVKLSSSEPHPAGLPSLVLSLLDSSDSSILTAVPIQEGQNSITILSDDLESGAYLIQVSASNQLTARYGLEITAFASGGFPEYAAQAGLPGAPFEGALGRHYAFGTKAINIGITSDPSLSTLLNPAGENVFFLTSPSFLSNSRAEISYEFSTDGETWNLLPSSAFRNTAMPNPIPPGYTGSSPIVDSFRLPSQPLKALLRFRVFLPDE